MAKSVKLSRDAKSYNIGILVAERYFDQTQSFYWSMYQEAIKTLTLYISSYILTTKLFLKA